MLNFILNEDNWPCWPMLPIKRRRPGNIPECGVLISGSGPTVYLTNLFTFNDNCETVAYDSFQAMIDDNWEID